MRSKLTLTPMLSPLVLIYCYPLFITFQQIFSPHDNTSIEIHENQFYKIGSLMLSITLPDFQLCKFMHTRPLIARCTLFLSSASNYQKPVTNLSGRIYSPHSSLLLFLFIADDLIELKIVTDFSHLAHALLFQGRKDADFFF